MNGDFIGSRVFMNRTIDAVRHIEEHTAEERPIDFDELE